MPRKFCPGRWSRVLLPPVGRSSAISELVKGILASPDALFVELGTFFSFSPYYDSNARDRFTELDSARAASEAVRKSCETVHIVKVDSSQWNLAYEYWPFATLDDSTESHRERQYEMRLTQPIGTCSLILFVAGIISIGKGPEYVSISSDSSRDEESFCRSMLCSYELALWRD
jgi:hypothetical protein